MIRFYKTPWIARVWYPNFVWSLPSEQNIYLTFDDGPDPDVTPWVIEQLKHVEAKATFFCLGENLIKYPNLVKKLIDSGHFIGNHTYRHLNGWNTSKELYLKDVQSCDHELRKLGIETNLFRPPYGRIKMSQKAELVDKEIIMWSHLSWDFKKGIDVAGSINRLKRAKGGSILVFHDSLKAFNNLKTMLPEILSHFSSKGFKFATLQ